MGYLSDVEKACAEKFSEIRDDKKWICVPGLFLARLFRYCNIFLSTNGAIMMEVAGYCGEAHDRVVDDPRPRGRERDDFNNLEACCYLTFMIATSAAGISLIAGAGVCWVLAWMFLFLSFIWCFQTDREYELSHATKVGKINGKMQAIRDEQRRSNSPDYLRVFEERRNRRLQVLQDQLDKLTDYKRQTDIIRYGRIPGEEVDVEAQVGVVNQVGENNDNREPAAAIVAPVPNEAIPVASIASNTVDDTTIIDAPHGVSFTNINDNPKSPSNETSATGTTNPQSPSSEQSQGSFWFFSSVFPA